MVLRDAAAQVQFAPISAVRRLLVTLGALCLYRFGLLIPIAGLDPDALDRLTLSGRLPMQRLSVFALGVTPIYSALILFEILKLIFPSLSLWENRSRTNAGRASGYLLFAGLGLAAFQAWGVAGAYERMPGLVDEPGLTFHLTVFASLVGATALLAWLGKAISQYGLGAGFWLLLLAPSFVALARSASASLVLLHAGELSVSSLLVEAIVALAALALITLACEADQPRAPSRRRRDPFAIVWAPLLANVAADTLFGLGTLAATWSGDADAARSPAFAPTSPWRLAFVAALIVVIALRRRQVAVSGGGEDRAQNIREWIVIAVQIAVTIGLAAAARATRTPFAISGPLLFIAGAAAVDVVRSARRALRGE